MKVTPEINKAVAEAMGNEVIHDIPISYVMLKSGTIWQPHLNAEQCLKVLEWYIEQTNVTLALDRVTARILYHKSDFKTAVVLAAYEYIKNQE